MALTLETIQPITLDGKKMIPKVNSELRLRLSDLSFGTDEQVAEAVNVLAECFPNDKNYAKEKIAGLTFFDMQTLQAYLIGGESAVSMITKSITEAIGAKNG